jgi:hypothetical protein
MEEHNHIHRIKKITKILEGNYISVNLDDVINEGPEGTQ